MKKFLYSATLAIASMWSFGCLSVSAQDGAVEFRNRIPAEPQIAANAEYVASEKSLSQYSTGTIDISGVSEAKSIAPVAGTRALPSSIGGEYVMTVKSLRPDLYGDTGNCVTVQPIADKDSVWLLNFWNNGTNIKAAVDLAKGTVSIPNQKIGVNDNGVTVDISSCDALGKPTRTKNIEGVINPDGTISITTWWGLFAVDGPDKDRYAFVGGDTEMERANATMSFSFLDGEKIKFGVVVTQPYDNQVIVKNFGNYGQSVKIWLDSSRGGYIPSQCARKDPSNKADFMTMAVADYAANGNPTTMAKNITLIPAAANNTTTLNWGKWSAFSIGTANMFFGPILDGKVEFNSGFRYPAPMAGEFEGTGTESDPYMIKSVMDFVRMADYVNSYKQAIPDTLGGFLSHLAYTGKYFKLASDLDISSRLLTPIGGDLNHLFNGSFDGAGHTLTGLAQEVGGAGLAGLFGMCGPQSVIKNVTIKDANISAEGLIASVLAGWTYGTMTGCGSINAKVSNTQRIASGLVGAAETISDCFVENAYIDGKGGNSAGLAGQVNVSIENCSVTNTTILAGSGADGYPAGGVVASMNGAKGKNLYFSGSIDSKVYMSTMTIGGIAGILSHGSLENSFAVGSITSGVSTTGRNAVAGGVVGTMYGSELTDSYFVGIAGTYYSRMAGGITGWVKPYTDVKGTVTQPVIKNCYTASVITSETYLYDSAKEVRESLGWIDETAKPTIENVYFDNQYTNLNSKLYGVPGSYLTSATGPTGFNSDKWLIAEGQYPRLKNMADNQAALMSASAILMAPQSSLKKLAANAALRPLGNTKFSLVNNGKLSNEGHFCKIENDSIVISNQFGTDTLAIQNGKMTLLYELKVAPVPFAGEGTEENPYRISTKQDMIALGHITSVVKQYFPQSHFIMTNDIDMELDPAFKGICINSDAYCKFAGVFDGGGYTLDNVLEEWVEWTKKPVDENDVTGTPNTATGAATENVKGIFGRLAEGAVIRNLTVGAGCKFTFWARSGAIVGQNEGLVENCRNFARIATLSSVAGGIVGENRKGIVRKCYNAGEVVSGYNSAGGIVGTGNGIIEECVNTGNVSLKVLSTFQKLSASMSKAGGIQGENTGTNFIDCVNFGTVSSYQNLAGGIAAQLSKITSTTVLGNNSVKNSISLGVINVEVDRTQMGAIGGNSGTAGTVEGVYWDEQIIPLKAQGGLTLQGATGVETSMLISGEPLPGYDTKIWNFEKGKYPVIAQFASEPKVQEARSLILLLAQGTNIDNLTDGATLEAPASATWNLKEGKNFKIEGNKLVSPSDVKESVTDILTLSSGSFSKVLNIACPPSIPLAGAGTATDPYQIASAADWNALADYAALTRKDFAGKYLKITKDIDFTDTSFKSIFSDGITNFSGTLDGDSHTVKGIKMTTTATYQGAIGTITSEGTVKNLTLEGAITTAQQYSGGFAGRVYGKIQNCENAISVTSTKAAVAGFGYIYGGAELTDVVNSGRITGSAGSVAGIASYTTDGVKFTRVVNKGVVESTATGTATYLGGLVAQCQPAIFEGCGNEGSFVIKTPTSANSVGGLVAYANSSAGHTVDYTFTDCYNRAEIKANNVLGGIVANTAATVSNISPLLMTNCVNYAPITSVATKSTTSSPTAGIAAFYNPGSKIEGCVNEGPVTSAFNVYAAGIVGQNKATGAATAPVLIKDCVNKGDIAANGNQGAGIMAISTNNVTISGCSNFGKITGGFGIAGIIAQLGGNDVELAYSWNAGDVVSSTYRVGGLIGWNTVIGTVHDCFNLGNISTTCENGGTSTSATAPSGCSIGGLAGQSACIFKRCYNMGDVKGASIVGGLIGMPYKNRTVIDSCYNGGRLIAPADTCGNLIGVNPKNGANWNTDNSISNSYYVKSSEKLQDNDLATGMTEAQLAAVELGKGWNSGDAYTYPMIAGVEPAVAKVFAARVITDDPAGELKVTGPFHVGLPEGLNWSSNNASVELQGNDVTIKGNYKGKVELTATCGDASRSVTVDVDVTSGVTDLDADKDYVDTFYTLDGIKIPVESLDKGVYIRIRTYCDGRTQTTRILR